MSWEVINLSAGRCDRCGGLVDGEPGQWMHCQACRELLARREASAALAGGLGKIQARERFAVGFQHGAESWGCQPFYPADTLPGSAYMLGLAAGRSARAAGLNGFDLPLQALRDMARALYDAGQAAQLPGLELLPDGKQGPVVSLEYSEHGGFWYIRQDFGELGCWDNCLYSRFESRAAGLAWLAWYRGELLSCHNGDGCALGVHRGNL